MKLLALLAALGTASAVFAETATFDDLAEGSPTKTFTDGGITFSNLFTDQPDGSTIFTIEDASATYAGSPGFSPNNVLNFGGYAPGDTTSFSPFTSFDMSTGNIEHAISMDLFIYDFRFPDFANNVGKTLTLELYREGSLVGSTSLDFTLHGEDLWYHDKLALSGMDFDSARLVASGASNNLFFANVDNVRFGAVPEPATMAGLALGAGLLFKRRRKA